MTSTGFLGKAEVQAGVEQEDGNLEVVVFLIFYFIGLV